MLFLGGDILSFRAKKVPKQTPLKAQDPENRLAYAKNGPILNGGILVLLNYPTTGIFGKQRSGF